MLSHSEFQSALERALFEQPTLTHPIIAEISDPNCHNVELLRLLALQGYQLTKEFSRYVAGLAMNCPIRKFIPPLVTNLYEEETGKLSGSDNHYQLMHKFLDGLGISSEEREGAIALPSTRDLIDYRWELVRNPASFHCGAAAILIASEGQNLERRRGMSRYDLLLSLGARFGYGEEHLQFFKVHSTEDEYHVQDGFDIVAAVCTSGKMQQEALEAVRVTCEKFRLFFDGVLMEYKMQCVGLHSPILPGAIHDSAR